MSIESTSAKRLKSTDLPSITGLDARRAKIAQAEDRGAVGDHRHQVALGGIVVGEIRIAGDGQHRHGHAGGIGKRQVTLRRHGLGRQIAILPGVGNLWNASASSSVKVRLSASLMGRQSVRSGIWVRCVGATLGEGPAP